MIESLYALGERVLGLGATGQKFLQALVEHPPRRKDGKAILHVLSLSTEKTSLRVRTVELSDFSEISDEQNEKGLNAKFFFWLGNAKSNEEQDRLTTSKLVYLVSQIVPNLLHRLPGGSDLHEILHHLFHAMYLDIGEPEKGAVSATYRRCRYVWDLHRLGIPCPSAAELKKLAREKDIKVVPQQIVQALIKAHPELDDKNQPALYTLEVDGQLLVRHPDYHKYIEHELIGKFYVNTNKGHCHITGKVVPVTADTSRLSWKYYITDKLGFASNVEKSRFDRSFALSEQAYRALLAGERFARRRLRWNIGRLPCFILPQLHLGSTPEYWAADLSAAMEHVQQVGKWFRAEEELDKEIRALLAEEGRFGLQAGFMFHLLFYRQSQSEFRVLELIRDVSEYRLAILSSELAKTVKEVGETISEHTNWILNLEQIYYLLPLRIVGGDVETRPLIHFYKQLIQGGSFEDYRLIQQFMEMVRIYQYDGFDQYQISRPDPAAGEWPLLSYVIKSLMVMEYLRRIGQLRTNLKGGNKMDELMMEAAQVPQVEQAFLKELGYDERRAALYLLGRILGEIASEQWRQARSEADGPTDEESGARSYDTGRAKVILNQLNFQGMSFARVQTLAVRLMDKMRQYRVLRPDTERLYNAARRLMDPHARDWDRHLTPVENVYYILSGYAHTGYVHRTRAESKRDTKNNDG